jgi:hypothetical protein
MYLLLQRQQWMQAEVKRSEDAIALASQLGMAPTDRAKKSTEEIAKGCLNFILKQLPMEHIVQTHLTHMLLTSPGPVGAAAKREEFINGLMDQIMWHIKVISARLVAEPSSDLSRMIDRILTQGSNLSEAQHQV